MDGKCVSLLLIAYQIAICSSVFNGKIVALIEKPGDGLPLLTTYSKEYPYMIEILESDNHLCGATLIKSNVVLTAAHCLPENKTDINVANYKVIGGNQLSGDLDSPMVQWRNVAKIIQHRLFDKLIIKDLALMQTDGDFEQNEYIRPINLPVGYGKNDFNGKLVVQLGWGAMENGNSSDLLLSMQSYVRPTRGCIDKWYQKYISQNMMHEHSMLCTQGFKGSVECFGDSGGPTVIHYKNDPSRDIIIGVASAVFDLPDASCDPKRPNLVGNVVTFLTWINNTINKHF